MGDWYPKKDLIAIEHRTKMLQLAFQNDPQIEVLSLSNTNQKTYAIDTFQAIDKKFPEANRFFIMGTDNYQKITNWKNAEELMKNYHYIVLDRENGNMKNISSSLVRERVKKCEVIDNFVPREVLEYIKQKNLYIEGNQ